jgi:hypothetical protein
VSDPQITTPDLTLVDKDEFCAACGYNLKTLSKAGICPECGAAVAPSLGHHPFRDAPRRWLLTIAIGLLLLDLSFVLTAVAVSITGHSSSNDTVEVLLLTAAPTGAKLWILTRFLQLDFSTTVKMMGLAVLLVHILGVLAITKRIPPSSPRDRWLRISLRTLLLSTPIFWLIYSWSPPPFRRFSDDIHSHTMMALTVFDVLCVILTNLVIAAISSRGGFKRLAICILLLMALQGAGLSLLFFAIYFTDSVTTLVWPALIMHGAAGLALSLITLFLIYKLLSAARRLRLNI